MGIVLISALMIAIVRRLKEGKINLAIGSWHGFGFFLFLVGVFHYFHHENAIPVVYSQASGIILGCYTYIYCSLSYFALLSSQLSTQLVWFHRVINILLYLFAIKSYSSLCYNNKRD
jgi:hypothetical protein